MKLLDQENWQISSIICNEKCHFNVCPVKIAFLPLRKLLGHYISRNFRNELGRKIQGLRLIAILLIDLINHSAPEPSPCCRRNCCVLSVSVFEKTLQLKEVLLTCLTPLSNCYSTNCCVLSVSVFEMNQKKYESWEYVF